jgi:acetyl-CoA acetyltransferase
MAKSARLSFLGKTAVVGVGFTPFSNQSGRTVMDLACSAIRAAVDDAGLQLKDVDGISTYSVFNDSVVAQGMATGLGLPNLTYILDFAQGGQSPTYLLMLAGMAIDSGMADTVVVVRALNGRSGARIGHIPFVGPSAQYRYPIGYTSFLYYHAMWTRRYMIETGATEADLGAVVIAQREWAAKNERAIMREPLTMEEYLASRWVAEPYRVLDCTKEVDGACAIVMTSLERARHLRHPPVVLRGGAFLLGKRPGLEIGDFVAWEDFSRNFFVDLAPRLWESAGLGPEDVDVAELYDCFSSVVLDTLEGLGFADRGGAGALIRAGETGMGGSIPTNTHGGLLSEGYLHGMNTLAEGVLQLQGRGGERQVTDATIAVVTSGANTDGTAVVLERER